MLSLLYLALLLIPFWILRKLYHLGRRQNGLPPGPPTTFALGNILDFPTAHPHIKFTEWARIYGDIYSLKLGSENIIIISSPEAVRDLLDKRGSVSNDRGTHPVVDMITGGLYPGLAPYSSDVWKNGRRSWQVLLAPEKVRKVVPLQHTETLTLMNDLLVDPENFSSAISRTTISTMLFTLYGRHAPSFQDEVVQAHRSYIHRWSHLAEPGGLPPTDLLPILRLLPERLAPWKALTKEIQQIQSTLFRGLFKDCEDRLDRGEGVGSFVEHLLNDKTLMGTASKDSIIYNVGSMLDAGADSSASFTHSFILLMVAYPNVQAKVRKEIDNVIGLARVPQYEDFDSLPYLQAVIKEIHRFRPISPTILPHATISDQQYRGHLIPKNAKILMNTWGIFHDPNLYEAPEEFRPDRYLQTEYGTKPGVDTSAFRPTLGFGAGRRLCPGVNSAANMIALVTMSLIWTFELANARDPFTGDVIPVDVSNYETGVVHCPRPFSCKIVPRSPEKARLIKQEFAKAKPI